jgi:MFS family permease
MAMVADLVTPQNRKAAFALNRLAINLGMSVGPALGGFLLLISYDFLFWIDGATSLVAGFVIAFSSLTRIQHREDDSNDGGVQVHAFKDRVFIIFLLASIPVWGVFFLHEGPMPLFLVHELKLPESDYGLLFTVNTMLIILFEVPLNLRMAHLSHVRALSLGSLLIGTGFGCTQFATGFWSAAATVSLWTLGEMIMLPTAATFVADIAPARQRGQYMGLYQMMSVLALSLSTWLGTWTFERFGSAVVWSGAFVFGLLSAILFRFLKGTRGSEIASTRR